MAKNVKESTIYKLAFDSATYCILNQVGPFAGLEYGDFDCWEEVHDTLECLMWDVSYHEERESRKEEESADAVNAGTHMEEAS